ncbi:MAG: CHASE2 domain-containing protein [Rhodospirillaceae bacterium]|nr:CHASE2 domain-containing protein [Rhodospirillaceae bacterium]MBT5809118.1 CHASE2 domain-containing protein [Rhodospirillaceae bacterium]
MRLTRGNSVLVGAVCAGLAVFLSLGGYAPAWVDGLLFDGALAVRAKLDQKDRPAISRQVAVVAVDSRSLESPGLVVLPRAMFSPVWAVLIDKLNAAGARTIAFDFLFSYSAQDIKADYDQSFLSALWRNRQKIVLGRSARTTPARKFLAAMQNDPTAMGLMDVFPDGDEIHRFRKTSHAIDDGAAMTTLVGGALAKAGFEKLSDEIILAPRAHPEDAIPTYALADVLQCAASDPETMKATFGNRLVFVGSTLPEEDRIVSSARFMKAASAKKQAIGACGLRPLLASAPGANTVPGVHLNAVAASAVAGGDLVRRATGWRPAAFAGAAAVVGAVIGFTLAPVAAAFVVMLSALALWAGEIGFLLAGSWMPMALSILALLGATIVAYIARFVLEERRRRRVQNAFGHYLAPELVKRLADGPQDLKLGGEQRDISVMFADLSGFTALSGMVGPEELMSRTNAYLKLIADEVEATGGYVDKFIGDAVMAIWGAPVEVSDHAAQSVAAAIRIGHRITAQREEAVAAGEHGFAVKIGVNCGAAVVGNVGSEKRFNYTAVGEAVNIAARLESLPGTYDCQIVVSGETAGRVGDRFIMRELDRVAVKGKAEPLRILEPLSNLDATEPPESFVRYGEALAAYRDRKFTEAAAIWDEIGDGPSLVMASRARVFADSPPAEPWDGVWVMTTK